MKNSNDIGPDLKPADRAGGEAKGLSILNPSISMHSGVKKVTFSGMC